MLNETWESICSGDYGNAWKKRHLTWWKNPWALSILDNWFRQQRLQNISYQHPLIYSTCSLPLRMVNLLERRHCSLLTDVCICGLPRVRTGDYQGVLQYVFSHPGGTSERAGQIMDPGPWHAHTFIPLSSQGAVNTEARATRDVGASPVHYHRRCHMLIIAFRRRHVERRDQHPSAAKTGGLLAWFKPLHFFKFQSLGWTECISSHRQ